MEANAEKIYMRSAYTTRNLKKKKKKGYLKEVFSCFGISLPRGSQDSFAIGSNSSCTKPCFP